MNHHHSWLPPTLRQRTADQIGILVPNLDLALARYAELFRVDSWAVYSYDDSFVPIREFRGEQGRFSMRLALGGKHPQIELIEPLEGPSIYHEWIDQHGYGLHHIGLFVDSVEDAVNEMTGAGFPVLQLGRGYGLDGDGGFAYFDTRDQVQIFTEAIEIPARRPSPLREFHFE